MKRTPLKRSTTPIRKRKYRKGEETIGKTGRIRLRGKKLEELRYARFLRDNETCLDCGKKVYYTARFDGDPDAYDMAHIVSRGAGGSDTIENTKTLCHACHMREHTEGKNTE